MNLPKTLIIFASLFMSTNIAFAQHVHGPQDQHTETTNVTLPGTYAEVDGDHTLGNVAAPVTMIIYASVTCPHCASWFNDVWPAVKTDYVETGKVRIVFREFPTAPAQLAIAGFQIANCAPEDKYFSLIEHQMLNQENIIEAVKAGKGLETYLAIAKLADLKDEIEMNACFDSMAGRQKMQNSMDLARSAGLNSVPSFIIAGETYKGSGDYLPLAKHLDKQLARGFSPMPKR